MERNNQNIIKSISNENNKLVENKVKNIISSLSFHTRDKEYKLEIRPCNISLKDNGNILVIPGKKIGKYTIVKKLGQGTFGTVVKATYKGVSYAIKVIANFPKYTKVAIKEIQILNLLSNEYIIKLIESYMCSNGNVIMVFRKYDLSMQDFIEKFKYTKSPYFFTQSEMKVILKQLTSAIAYMHTKGIIHTDLKPGNIMFEDGTLNAQGRLINLNIKVIDLGGAKYQKTINTNKSQLGTQHFMAPEVVLGLHRSYPLDIWSIGALLMELYVGGTLFETNNNVEHLAMMEKVLGKLPIKGFIDKVLEPENQWFDVNYALRFPALAPDPMYISHITSMIPLKDIVLKSHPRLLDLFTKMFKYKPDERITAEEILKHPYLLDVTLNN